MSPSTSAPTRAPRLQASGVARIVTILVVLTLQAAAFFAAAGTLRLPRALLYFGAVALYMLGSLAFMALRLPAAAEIVNQRGKLARDAKSWDKRIGLVTAVLTLLTPVIAGLDVRQHGPRFGAVPFAIALLAALAAMALSQWAMLENRFLETGVRIQRERGHTVIDTGPYRLVRHPFYLGMAIQQIALPICLGAPWSLLPTGALLALLVLRTHLEDRTLRRELPGYTEYARRTRHRLLPHLW